MQQWILIMSENILLLESTYFITIVEIVVDEMVDWIEFVISVSNYNNLVNIIKDDIVVKGGREGGKEEKKRKEKKRKEKKRKEKKRKEKKRKEKKRKEKKRKEKKQ